MAAEEFEIEESDAQGSMGRRLRELLEARSRSQDTFVVERRRSDSCSGPWLSRLRPKLPRRLPALCCADGLFARFYRSLWRTAEAWAVSARRRLGANALRAAKGLAESRLNAQARAPKAKRERLEYTGLTALSGLEELQRKRRAFVRGEFAERLERVSSVLGRAWVQLASCATGVGRRKAELAGNRRARELQRQLEADWAPQTCADQREGEASEDGHWLAPAAGPALRSALAWASDCLRPQPAGGDERSAPPGDGGVLMARGRCNFFGLTSLVASRAVEFPDALEEWQAYLHNLQPYADNEGYLPPQLASLVASVFAPLLEAPRGLRSHSLYAPAAEAR